MPFWNKYPYTDFHELNLDWILSKIKSLDTTVSDFTAYNAINWAGKWDGNKTYPAWSIVQDDNGNGYLALKAVPQNVNLTNADYWQKIADYDALYSAFNDRIASLEDTNKTLASNIDSLTNDSTILASRVDVVANTRAPSNLANAKIVAIGDSYGNGSGGTVGQGWPYWLAQKSGADVRAWYGSGSGFINTSNGNGNVPAGLTFLDILNNYAVPNTTDKNEIDYVICCGGYNDHNNTAANIRTAVRTWYTAAKNAFPNAKIVIIPLNNKQTTHNLRTCFAAVFNGAKTSGAVTTLEAVNWLIGYAYMTNDDAHPTAAGYEYIGECLTTFLSGGNSDFTNTTMYTVADGWTLSSGYLNRIGNVVTIRGQMTYSGTPTQNTSVGTMPDSMIPTSQVLVPCLVLSTAARFTTFLRLQTDGTIVPLAGTINGQRFDAAENCTIYFYGMYNMDTT